MENATYATLTRQSGLMRETQVIANNIANAATTGFKAEGVTFSEHISKLDGRHPSLSMASGRVRQTQLHQGTITTTGGAYDLAISGDAYFLVQTGDGIRLTRAGHFTTTAQGDLVTMDGNPVLDAGGAPVFIPTGNGPVSIASDGTISAGDQVTGQVGMVTPEDPALMTREGGTLFRANEGYGPAENATMIQGALEESNVDPIAQISRLISVQRAYELGQKFLDAEDERMRSVAKAMR